MSSLRVAGIAARAARTSLLRASASRVNGSVAATRKFHTSPVVRGSQDLINEENSFSAHNYHPLPVVFSRAEGCHVWDPEGKHYYDFLSAYSAVNQGHCHPKIIGAAIEQLKNVTLSSRAFHNDVFPKFAHYVTEYFGFDRVLPMNTGAEAVETALKISRKWGHQVKGIKSETAKVIACDECFHGRTIGAISLSNDPEARKGFGPFLPGILKVPFNDLAALETCLKANHEDTAAFIVEPIQGEAGVYVPDEGYLTKARELCKKYNVLFVADEVQTGVARTGKMLAIDHENIKPDILILGKAISGGVYPVSAVLANNDVMDVITPGTHGSTYGGNPVGCATAIAALQVIKDEGLVERSAHLGEILRQGLRDIKSPLVTTVRGKGLLNAFIIDNSKGIPAWDVCMQLKEKGLLCKPTHDNIVRLAPPLVISEPEIRECIEILGSVLRR
mmetsp:Transcript_33757/g.77129  ORF Transcript_33757/g.77129 Transcript_33757/m.77129 type:complete len:446 (+) Transcript_33757:3-1340(+)